MDSLTVGLAVETEALQEEVRACLRQLTARVVLEHEDIDAFVEGLEKARPDVVLVDLSRSAERIGQVARAAKNASLNTMLIALHTSADPDGILAALRAGANEYLYPPLEANLRGVLERRTEEPGGAHRGVRGKGKSIAFLSAKGGCGATTIACHVAVELGRHRGTRALLVDLDLSVGMVHFLMKCASPYSVLDALHNVHRLDLNYWKALVSNGCSGLEVMTAPADLPSGPPPSLEPLRHVLSFARSNYDWTVADLGRNLSPLAMTALEEIDELYLVASLDVPALHQAKRILNQLVASDYGGNRIRLVLNRAPARPNIAAGDVEKMIGHPIFIVLPEDAPALFDCFCEGKLLPAGSALAKHLARLAQRIAGIPEQKGRSAARGILSATARFIAARGGEK